MDAIFVLSLVGNALPDHGVGHLHEAGDVGARHQVAGHAVLLGGLGGVVVDVGHDVVELLVHFLEGPAQTHGVLAHLQAGGGYAAGIGSLGGSKQHTVLLEPGNRLGGGGHIGALGHSEAAVFHQGLGALQGQLVLGGAGEGDAAGNSPDALAALVILGGGDVIQVGLDALPLDLLDLLDDLVVDAVLIHDVAVGVAHGNDLAAQLSGLLVGVDSHVAGTGDDYALALEGLAGSLKHLVSKVAQAVAGGLGTGQRTAVAQALAGNHAVKLVADALILAEQIADLTGAHANVAGGHVGVRADVALQLGHKGLAETHDLVAALALGVKVGTALTAAHGQAGEGVLEYLLKAQELDDGQVDGRVEPQAALGGADGGGELDPIAAVHLDLAVIVHPGDAEEQAALRFHHALNDAGPGQLGLLVEHGLERLQNFAYGLKKLGLMSVFCADVFIDALQVGIRKSKCHSSKPLCLAAPPGRPKFCDGLPLCKTLCCVEVIIIHIS